MRISACYIIGENEVEFERSLQSIRSFVQEIIVVDTTNGKDKGVAFLVEKYKGQIYPYAWCDDFSAARNFAIEKAKGDWIVFLDADEYFSRISEKSFNEMLRGAEKQEAEALLVKIFNIDEDQDNQVLDAFFAPRVFKRMKEIRYAGKVHESLLSIHGGLRTAYITELELHIYHTGYSTNKLQAKAKRNLALLLQELEVEDTPSRLYMALAEAYEGLGDAAEALKYAWMDIDNGRQNITYASRSYRVLLRILENQQQINEAEIRNVLKKAVENFPELPEFHAEYAQYLASDLRWKEAIAEMEQAFLCMDNYTSIEPTTFTQDQKNISQKLLLDWQQKSKRQKEIKISACVIVKNEEAEIARWIENMQEFSDEQIIVDTGSTDRTIEIVNSYGVSVHLYEWKDDFSAAKNFALEKAQGSWIAFLDADEYFSQDSVNRVRAVIAEIEGSNQYFDTIMCLEIDIDVEKNNIELDRFLSLRLFRNSKELRYIGSVHEHLQSSKGLNIYTDKKYLKIYHTGYSESRLHKKLLRNLDILKQDIAKNGEGPQHYRYLLDTYHILGEHKKAIKYGKLHLASTATSVGMESHVYTSLINSMVFLHESETEIRKYIMEAIGKFKDIPDFYACMAGSFLREKNWNNAKKYLLESLSVYEKNFESIMNSSNYMYIITAVYSNLAEIFYHQGNLEEANRYVDLSLKKNKYNTEAFKQLYKLLSGKHLSEKKYALQKWYEQSEKDWMFLTSELEKIEIGELYFYCIEELEKFSKSVVEKKKFYKMIKNKESEKTFTYAIDKGVRNLEFVIHALFFNPDAVAYKSVEKIVPNEMYRCIERYYDKTVPKLAEKDVDGYKTLLGILAKYSREQSIFWETFIKISADFSADFLPEFLDVLFEKQCFYPVQFLAIETIDFKIEDIRKAAFFLELGISLYYCGAYKRAQLYLKKNVFEGIQLKEAESYLTWIDEKTAGL